MFMLTIVVALSSGTFFGTELRQQILLEYKL